MILKPVPSIFVTEFDDGVIVCRRLRDWRLDRIRHGAYSRRCNIDRFRPCSPLARGAQQGPTLAYRPAVSRTRIAPRRSLVWPTYVLPRSTRLSQAAMRAPHLMFGSPPTTSLAAPARSAAQPM